MNEVIRVLEATLGPGRCVNELKGEWQFTCPKCHHPEHLHVCLSKQVFICVTPFCNFRGPLSLLTNVRPANNTMENISIVSINDVRHIYYRLVELGTLRDAHRDWLIARGISPTFTTFCSTDGLLAKLQKEFSNDELIRAGLLRKYGLRYIATPVLQPNGIIIPYYSNDNKVWYIRTRLLQENALAKYVSPSGVRAAHLSWGWHKLKPNSKFMVFTEGEFKAIAVLQQGINCVGLPGMLIGHSAAAEQAKAFGIRQACIIFDTDVGLTQEQIPKYLVVNSAVERLATYLKNNNIQPFRAVLPSNGQKVDLDSFILSVREPQKALLTLIKDAYPI